jgi:hypothetical protein
MGSFEADTRVFDELRRKIGSAKHAFIKLGVLASQGGAAIVDGEMTLAEIAAIHEFGAPRANIPRRSFLLDTFQEGEGLDALQKFLTRIARGILNNQLTVDQALGQLGVWAVSQVKRRIKEHIPPPLKPATIRRKTVDGKEGDVPLVDTAQLLNAITYEVQK